MEITPDLRQRVDELFAAVVGLPAEQQSAFLDRACADDPRLRAEVESLLWHDSHAEPGFLQPPAVAEFDDLLTPKPPDLLLGQVVGGFQIKRLIAAGGMGTVYEAEQQHPRRTVALKVMHGWVASPAVARRFQLEAEILGRLRHPHIAQVYHAGVHELGGVRVPYFAMEYVPDARPITQYADDYGLNTRQRLELLVKVCDAVQHGHRRGVIHRDLKPGNILIDAEGEPKVIDFGVARATDADVAMTTQCTAAGQIVGTVQYMSPEQCDGDSHEIDTRSDVYSLGVVLYELLTGALPYDTTGSTIYAATRTIKEQTPQKPSTRLAGRTAHPVRSAGPPSPASDQAGADTGPNVAAGLRTGRGSPGGFAPNREGDTPNTEAQAPNREGEAPAEPPVAPVVAAGLRTGRPAGAAAFMPRSRRTRSSGATGERGPLARELRGDVDTIVLKALEKDREKRYASAAELAADIRRYLNHEPILARPPTRWARAVRWVARHPYVTTATACLLLAAFVVAATYVAVWVVNERPAGFVYVRDLGYEHRRECREARLVAFNGRTLRAWSGPFPSSVPFAQLLDRPRALGGGKVAIVLYQPDSIGYTPYELCIYDTRVSIHDPEWTAKLRDGDPLPDPHGRGYQARQFNPFLADAADIFPEHPGVELIAAFVRQAYSQFVIRIYDLRGEVLYEIWHDGGVSSCYWMRDAKQLVFTGANAEVDWEDRGYPGLERPHPWVIFAIRPRYGERVHALLRTEPGDAPCDPVWYKCLWPPEWTARDRGGFSFYETTRPIKADPGRAVGVGVYWDEVGVFSVEVDEHGEEIPGTRVISDGYRRARKAADVQPSTDPADAASADTGSAGAASGDRGSVGAGDDELVPPDPAVITLHDLPPILPSATRPARP